jgi:pyridoxal phosphate enzyme (YggS family)
VAGGRNVRLVAVTKGFGADAIAAVRAAGVDDIGESYAQELLARRDVLDGARVHFIGRVQTNKVRSVAALVDLWQSVDREQAAVEIARRAPGAEVLVQVNVSGEETKAGCSPAETPLFVARCQELGLEVRGLMTIAARQSASRSAADAASGFARLRTLVDRLGLPECSMGMSDDFEAAVGEGATLIRVGAAIFGPRQPTSGPNV